MKDQTPSSKKSLGQLKADLRDRETLLKNLKAFGMEAALHQSRFMNFHICYSLRPSEQEPKEFQENPDNLPSSLKEFIKMISGDIEVEVYSLNGSDKHEGGSFEDLIPTMMGLSLLDLMEFKIKEDIDRIKKDLLTFKID